MTFSKTRKTYQIVLDYSFYDGISDELKAARIEIQEKKMKEGYPIRVGRDEPGIILVSFTEI